MFIRKLLMLFFVLSRGYAIGNGDFSTEDVFCWFYDFFYDQARDAKDLLFYIDQLKKVGKDILEVGCGTGRILIPIAQAGKQIDGIEPNSESLHYLLQKVHQLPPDKQRNIQLYNTSFLHFEPTKQYDAIIFPFRVIQHFYNIDEQIANMRAAKKWLKENGVIILDTFFMRFEEISQGIGEWALCDVKEDPLQQIRIEKWFYKEGLDLKDLFFSGFWKYRIFCQGCLREEIQEDFKMSFYTYPHLKLLFQVCGLEIVSEFGDFEGTPIGKGGEMVFVLQKAAE